MAEELLALSDKLYQRTIYTAHNTEAECFEAGKKVQLEHDQAQLAKAKPIIEKAERERIIDWGDENCPHREQNGWHLKHYCPKCWQALKEGK